MSSFWNRETLHFVIPQLPSSLYPCIEALVLTRSFDHFLTYMASIGSPDYWYESHASCDLSNISGSHGDEVIVQLIINCDLA